MPSPLPGDQIWDLVLPEWPIGFLRQTGMGNDSTKQNQDDEDAEFHSLRAVVFDSRDSYCASPEEICDHRLWSRSLWPGLHPEIPPCAVRSEHHFGRRNPHDHWRHARP